MRESDTQREDELNRIREAYSARRKGEVGVSQSKDRKYIDYLLAERNKVMTKILSRLFRDFERVQMIDIGTSNGKNLFYFHGLGIPWDGIWANELLADRVESLRLKIPELKNIEQGDASELPYVDKFDIVNLSTVLSSILDPETKKRLASKALELAKPKGVVILYDFIYDNPRNKNVKGVGRHEIKDLFKGCKSVEFYRTTLAPPIGKRIGPFYTIVNTLFPFLRTHMVSVITKA